MARNNNKMTKRRSAKIEPAVTTLRFPVTNVTGQSTSFIDLSQCASLISRRFYRQGLNWAVRSIKILASSGDPNNRAQGFVAVSKLPTSWTMSGSWMKAFSAWEDMNDFALEDTESIKPRFLDFKIYADSDHHAAGFGANLLPISIDGGVATPGEWIPSQVHIPSEPPAPGGGATRDRELIATGASYPGAGFTGFDAVSLIEGYASSRGLPNVLDPNAPDDAADVDGIAPENWIGALKNEGTEQKKDVLEDMLADNNIAPYPFENDGVNLDTMYPGGANQLAGLAFHDDAYITSSTIGGTTRLQGGSFPCGLMKIVVLNTTESEPGVPLDIEYSVQVELVPGSHRGYLCSPMQDM